MLNGDIKMICKGCVQLRQHLWCRSKTKGNKQIVQRKASENLQCSRMSKLANETFDIFVQQAM